MTSCDGLLSRMVDREGSQSFCLHIDFTWLLHARSSRVTFWIIETRIKLFTWRIPLFPTHQETSSHPALSVNSYRRLLSSLSLVYAKRRPGKIEQSRKTRLWGRSQTKAKVMCSLTSPYCYIVTKLKAPCKNFLSSTHHFHTSASAIRHGLSLHSYFLHHP